MQLIPDDIDFDAYLRDDDDGMAKIRPASEFVDDVVQLIHGEQEFSGHETPWSKIGNRLMFRPGEVSLWAGVNGHGKSGALGYVQLDVIVKGGKSCIASLEMPPAATMGRMCRQAAASNAPTIEYIERFHRWTDGKLWLYAHQGQVQGDRMLGVARYCRKELGVDHFVIDSLMKCGLAPDDYAGQKNFVDALCVLARDTGLHIHLVHHIRKGDTEKNAPDKFDIKGAGEITDLVDNVLVVFRNKRKEALVAKAAAQDDRLALEELRAHPDTLLICDKQRHFTWEGTVGLYFDRDSQQLRGEHNAGAHYVDFEANQWKQEWRR